jgi:hypothetical protein
VDSVFHIPGWDENVLFAESPVIGYDETVAIPMATEDSRNKVFASGQGIASSLYAMDDSFRVQVIEEILQTPAIVAVQVQKAHDVAE